MVEKKPGVSAREHPLPASPAGTPDICIAAPFPPPYGGMAVQAEKLSLALERHGWRICRVAVNQPFSRRLAWVDRIPVARTVVRTLLFLNALRRALRHHDTVYLLSGFFGYFFWVSAPAILLAKARRKRIFLSARGGAAGRYFRKYGRLIHPLIMMLDGVTAPSPFLIRAFHESFGVSVRLVPNIADLDQFRYRERSPVKCRLLCARNFEPIYNVSCTIRAFAAIRQRFPDAVLGLAGDGSARRELESLCRELGVSESVTFMGQIPHNRMQSVYEDYDILINSSNEDNLPGVILEAFASGLPVVSTCAGGIPFLVENGVTGLLVEKDNPAALAQAVMRLLEDPPLALRLAANARRSCERFSPEGAVREMERLLRPAPIDTESPL